ncbi:MAG: ATP-dependent DNA ligase [Actinobacteria bacterium]|nr:ATP-dependent DNA ligase [Actinomycetota bacterium]
MDLPVTMPLKPMLARAERELPRGDLLYEPKWDGFRCLVFRDHDEVALQSRNGRPLTRYFPELIDPLLEHLPKRCVLDGELVVVGPHGLDFGLLSDRIDPATKRIAVLAGVAPASFVAFDVLALDEDLRDEPLRERRAALVELLADARPPVHLTPVTEDVDVAQAWFNRFVGAGFDGVVAKPLSGTYVADKRVQFKVKHHRTIECVVGGYEPHKEGGVGSLLLGLHAGVDGPLQLIGACSAFSAAKRRTMAAELAAHMIDREAHPWSTNPGVDQDEWMPLDGSLVVEVTCENADHGRLRHPARFVRWRPDREPGSCDLAQLGAAAPSEFTEVFGQSDS